MTRRSISIRRRCAASPCSATGGSAASTSSTERLAKGSARFTSSAAIRPKATARWASSSPTSAPRWPRRSPVQAGWIRRPGRPPRSSSQFDPRIGHPAKYVDYSTLKVDRGDLFGNVLRSEQFDWDLQLSRYPKPVDRSLWDMLPQTNNAYYNPSTNQITFPAAILQPPYFDPECRPRRQLRQHRRDHRPRDRSRVRRPGPQVRRHRPPSRLVDQGNRRKI